MKCLSQNNWELAPLPLRIHECWGYRCAPLHTLYNGNRVQGFLQARPALCQLRVSYRPPFFPCPEPPLSLCTAVPPPLRYLRWLLLASKPHEFTASVCDGRVDSVSLPGRPWDSTHWLSILLQLPWSPRATWHLPNTFGTKHKNPLHV